MDDYIFLEDTSSPFPPTHLARKNPNGLLAIGGDLNPERLLNAYKSGIFPWFNPGEPVLWWTPNPRCIFRTDRIHISKSLHKFLKKHSFSITLDTAFKEVVTACGKPRKSSSESWIHQPVIDAYCTLHSMGYAHSIEVWDQKVLVGGLYGVSLGRMFFGESMFSTATNASKIALVYLAGQLRDWGFPILDCQVPNPHLKSLGAEEISRNEFEKILLEYRVKESPAHPWTLNWRYG